VRARLDDRVGTAFGRRATDWELKGVPVRVEVGPRDLAEGQVVLARRDDGTKSPVAVAELAGRVPALLDDIQASLLREATERRDAGTVDVTTVAAAAEAAGTGFARIPWAALADGGIEELGRSAITVRCLLTDDGDVPDGPDDGTIAVVARSY
jgi:prolyl-tRNA synthetase